MRTHYKTELISLYQFSLPLALARFGLTKSLKFFKNICSFHYPYPLKIKISNIYSTSFSFIRWWIKWGYYYSFLLDTCILFNSRVWVPDPLAQPELAGAAVRGPRHLGHGRGWRGRRHGQHGEIIFITTILLMCMYCRCTCRGGGKPWTCPSPASSRPSSSSRRPSCWWGLELQTKVIWRFPKISQSRRRDWGL